MSHLELLSPAGNPELALAAFDGGADAVYCGLGSFNARARAENFTADSLGRLIRFAHENGKKVYVTFNTLIFEPELGAMFEALAELSKLRPDAVIVQDPGVAWTVRNYFPELTLHASTQMGIHNSAGLQCAAKCGFKRVILERQVTLDELRLMAADPPVELEVFVHGSLCCSLSGRCLLSGTLCHASGNRGQCRQLCRKLYRPAKKPEGYWLSPGDLNGVSLLDEFRKLKISSLKIEGRLRTPDYVWKTARAYRILLDSPGDPAAHEESAALLRAAVSRKSGTAFYHKRNWDTLIAPDASGVFGETAAEVKQILRRGILVEVLTSLHLGDRLRAGSDGKSFSLTGMEKSRGSRTLRAGVGEKVFIPGSFQLKNGDKLLRIGENGFDFSRRAGTLPEFRHRLQLTIHAAADGFTGTIGGITGKWHAPAGFARADRHPLTAESVKKVFAEGAPAGFAAAEIAVTVTGEFFVPAAELKALRRNFWEFFAPILRNSDLYPQIAEKMAKFFADHQQSGGGFQAASPAGSAFTVPPFIPETELEMCRQKIAAASQQGIRTFIATGWHAPELLREVPEDAEIRFDFPFPVTNSIAVRMAAALGADSVVAAPETPAETLETIRQYAPLAVHTATADVPLLATRLPLPSGNWSDRNGHDFCVSRRDGVSLLFMVPPEE